jgi:methylmalonyl-CoA/ethylmalonyl-CoA epimerase
MAAPMMTTANNLIVHFLGNINFFLIMMMRRLFTTTTRARHSSAPSVDKSLLRVGELNHVAIAVPDLDASTALYRDVLGASVSSKQDLPEHGVTTVFVELGNTKLELLYPLGERSPIANFLKKNPAGGIHHICLEVDDIHVAVDTMKESGVRVIDEQPRIGAHGKPVVFCHPKSMNGVLVEFEQK